MRSETVELGPQRRRRLELPAAPLVSERMQPDAVAVQQLLQLQPVGVLAISYHTYNSRVSESVGQSVRVGYSMITERTNERTRQRSSCLAIKLTGWLPACAHQIFVVRLTV